MKCPKCSSDMIPDQEVAFTTVSKSEQLTYIVSKVYYKCLKCENMRYQTHKERLDTINDNKIPNIISNIVGALYD